MDYLIIIFGLVFLFGFFCLVFGFEAKGAKTQEFI